MTENQAAESAAEPQTGAVEGSDQGTHDTRRDDRYRTQLREAETERDALRGRVDALIGREVERLLGDRLTDVPMALRAMGKTPADFLDDGGLVDVKAVETFAETVAEKVPAFRRSNMPVADGSGWPRGGKVTPRKSLGWADVLGASPGSTD